MRAVAMHAQHGVGQPLAGCPAVGKPGEGIVIFQVADLRLGLAALLASHPGEGSRGGDADAEQEQRDGGDQAKIVGKDGGLFALVEVDDDGAARLAVGGERNSEGGEMGRAGSTRGGIQRDLGRLAGRIGKHIGGLVAEREPGQPAGEGEVAPLVVKLVADHAVVVARFRQDVAEFRRKPRRVRASNRASGSFSISACTRLAATCASRSSSSRLMRLGATKAVAAISALSSTNPALCEFFLSDAKADMNDRR